MEVEQQQGLIYYIQKVGRERKGRDGEREREKEEREKEGRERREREKEGEREERRDGKRRKGGRGRKDLATLYSEKLAEGEDVGVLRREKERGEVQHLQFLLESLNTMLTHIHISLYRSQKQQNLYVHWIGSLMIWLE